MSTILVSTIDKLINAAETSELSSWYSRVAEFLGEVFGEDAKRHIESLSLQMDKQAGVGYLEALKVKDIMKTAEDSAIFGFTGKFGENKGSVGSGFVTASVFIVHGHDDEAKEKVARFIEKLGLSAVILHEQASEGQTIIEKFEKHSNVTYTVVLLTGDDVGAVAENQSSLRNRARQNVVFELGYFIGKLGRNKVVALYKDDVEIPSDYSGVCYIEMDAPGAWKTKFAQELVKAKISIDLNGLL